MLTFLKRLFGRKAAATSDSPAPAPLSTPPVPAPPADHLSASSTQFKPQVAVAQLSLAAIIDRFPADLRGNVVQPPAATVTVALPLATIHKQLPGGSVKMSLASLYRQAPAGTFTQTRVEDKRMVEVPLSEVFRHVDAQALRRRGDQRRVALPKGAPGLFGDKANPFAVAPLAEEEEEEPSEEEVLAAEVPPEEPAVEIQPIRFAPALPREPAPLPEPGGPFLLPLAALCEGWPEPFRSEAENMNGAQVDLSQAALGASLAKGKVAFAWGQIRAWIQPPPGLDTAGSESTELVLPLKVVAPAWFAHSRPGVRRKVVEVDASIPALFGGGQALAPVVPDLAPPEPVPEPAAAPEPAPAPLSMRLAPPEELAPLPATALPATTPLPPPVSDAPVASLTLGELFGEPQKTQWSAQELIERSSRLPGVAGAVLALQEGLLVTARLPEEIKGDTVAAFLPQIFARLNHYSGEMKLGKVDDVLLSMEGAHLQAWKLGEVFFAVLGLPGAALPWEALRLVVQELKAQAPQ